MFPWMAVMLEPLPNIINDGFLDHYEVLIMQGRWVFGRSMFRQPTDLFLKKWEPYHVHLCHC
jgi:hypothetical protein